MHWADWYLAAASHNSSYVHRRLGRRLGLRGAAARRSATSAPRLGQPRGRVTYVRYVIGNYAGWFMKHYTVLQGTNGVWTVTLEPFDLNDGNRQNNRTPGE